MKTRQRVKRRQPFWANSASAHSGTSFAVKCCVAPEAARIVCRGEGEAAD